MVLRIGPARRGTGKGRLRESKKGESIMGEIQIKTARQKGETRGGKRMYFSEKVALVRQKDPSL